MTDVQSLRVFNQVEGQFYWFDVKQATDAAYSALCGAARKAEDVMEVDLAAKLFSLAADVKMLQENCKLLIRMGIK